MEFQKLQEYKNLKESLNKVYVIVGCDDEIEIYESKELAEEAAYSCCKTVAEVPIRNARFLQLHNEIFLETKDLGTCDYTDDGEEEESDDDLPVAHTAAVSKPTTADIQNRLKNMSMLKGISSVNVCSTKQTVTESMNNDGRLTCYACGEPTKIVDTGFGKPYYICTVCGK